MLAGEHDGDEPVHADVDQRPGARAQRGLQGPRPRGRPRRGEAHRGRDHRNLPRIRHE